MQKFPNIPNKNLEHFGYRMEPFFTSSMISGGMCDAGRVKKVFGLSRPLKILWVGFEIFNPQSALKNFTADVSKKLEQSGKLYMDNIIRQCVSGGNSLLKLARDINRKTSRKKLSPARLAELLDEYYEAVYNFCVFYVLAWFEKPERDLAERIAKKYTTNQARFRELFNLITSPSRKTAAEQEQDDFLALCTRTQKKKANINRLAEIHAKKYGWLGVRYFIGSPWTKQDVINRLKSADKNRAAFLLAERFARRKNIEQNIKPWLRRMDIKDRELVKQIRTVVFLRTQRADYYHRSSAYLLPLVNQIAEYLNIEYKDLLNFSPEELLLALKGKFDVRPHVKPRRECIVTYHTGGNICLEGQTAKNYVNARPTLQLLAKKSLKELTGQSTYPGIVKGPAKVVFTNEQASKVKKGDILVATMTTPNLIAAMEKASAFITNEGGILCHAAIVSREMKKPCVIGTKVATKIFKDGDIIKVDANKGIVKKVS